MKKLSMHGVIEWVKRFHISKNVKYSTIVFALIALVTGIALLVNLMAGFAEDKLNLKWDLTSNKLFTIGDDTRTILDGLERDVTIYGTFDNGESGALTSYPDAANILQQYEEYSHVKVEYIDLDRTPGFITDIDPDNLYDIGKNEFVVECDNKIKKLDAYDIFEVQSDYYSTTAVGSNAEQAFTGAIIYVTSDVTPVIYFSTGHGEPEIDSYYTSLKKLLERNNYEVKTLNLLSETEVPQDALALIYLSPQNDISSSEKEKLKDYLLNRAGKAMFFVDPLMGNEEMPEMNSLLGEFNIAVNYDTVMENNTDMYYPASQYYLIPQLKQTTVTESLDAKSFLMLVPGARSVEILKNDKENITVNTLLTTSDEADSVSTISEDRNKTGLLNLAVASEYTSSKGSSRIMVMGNSVFMADEVMQSFGSNGLEFFTSSLFWMHEDREEIFIATKMYPTNTINMNTTAQSLFTVILLVFLPVLILGIGIFVYLRRRHL